MRGVRGYRVLDGCRHDDRRSDDGDQLDLCNQHDLIHTDL
jgi:hypothetical protein